MEHKHLFVVVAMTLCSFSQIAVAQTAVRLPKVFGPEFARHARKDGLSRVYLTAQRIVWKSDTTGKWVRGAAHLLEPDNGQADLSNHALCELRNDGSRQAGILLDFGKELHGGIHLTTGMMAVHGPVRVHIRLGESVSEAMSDLADTVHNATNDHAMRDFVISLPWLGSLEIGNSGFRFVRIDVVDSNAEVLLKNVSAIFVYRDIPYLGSFRCSDSLLNKIWMTGAYTVQLNMQDYLWDGIKRDRLVWMGDMGPEIATISSVFGDNDVVPKSLDLARDITPLPGWMSGISAYSMWWILIQRDWYMANGNLPYLRQQKRYLQGLLHLLISKIGPDGSERLDGGRFLDWPTSNDPQAVHAGLQALMVMALEAGVSLCKTLDDPETARACLKALQKLKQAVPEKYDSKQAAALLSLAGLVDPRKANETVIEKDGAHRFSTFYGYYMLQAQALAGDYQDALDNIRTYWGAMLKLGATTFWEDFNLDWLQNAAPIDELVPAGKKDIHGDYGAYCYLGFRHSLCHGWASGPTSWLTEHVLGIQVVEPGCRVIRVTPHLADLQWAEGTFPTPYGPLMVKAQKLPDGKITLDVQAPKEVKIIKS